MTRGALETSTLSYLAAHYLEGVGCVYAVPDSPDMVIQIVANKYNPTNYWSAHLRTFGVCILTLTGLGDGDRNTR